jgi:tripartite-type tricarboxylate transporter receptor subunit TctC
MSWFNTLYGVKLDHVTYNGLPPALQDVMASRVDVTVAIAGGVMPYVNTGKLKAFGIAGSSRARIGPGVPTFAESGFPDFEASVYFGLVAPAGTPAEIVQKISSDVSRIVRSSEFNDKYLVNFGFEPVGETPAQFTAFLKKDRESAAKRVRAANVRLD